jgi:nucleotide-binding universal stress UspA family protein
VYQRALLTTDGSEVAQAAFEQVKQVVDPGGSVTVVQVVDDVAHVLARTTPAGFEFGSTAAFDARVAEEVVGAQRAAAEEHLAEARAALEQDGITNIETAILVGLPGDAIVKEATARDCDVVIMATHGRSGLTRAVLGSVADYVLRHVPGIPVLLVHPVHE